MRIDLYLCEHQYFDSRSKAQDAIKAGRVHYQNRVIKKCSHEIELTDKVTIREMVEYHSRSAFKLLDALNSFKIDLNGLNCLDVGASTGGFTQVCLQYGANFVYACDVGSNQLADDLRCNPKVKNLEKTHIKDLDTQAFKYPVKFICVDVSFISLQMVLPHIWNKLPDSEAVILLKPQFEVGKEFVGKNGIVKSLKLHLSSINNIVSLIQENGYYIQHFKPCSMCGRGGNQEYLIHYSKKVNNKNIDYRTIINTK